MNPLYDEPRTKLRRVPSRLRDGCGVDPDPVVIEPDDVVIGRKVFDGIGPEEQKRFDLSTLGIGKHRPGWPPVKRDLVGRRSDEIVRINAPHPWELAIDEVIKPQKG